MEGESVIGLVITVVTVVVLVGGLVTFLILGVRDELPKGVLATATFNGYEGTVVLDQYTGQHTVRARHEDAAHTAARAAWATAMAWKGVKSEDRSKALKRVVVWVREDSAFNDMVRQSMPGRDPSNVAAFLLFVRRRIGQGPPMPVVRASLLDHLIETGSLVIHELLHADSALIHDRQHKTVGVWEGTAHRTVEDQAQHMMR